MTSTTIVVTSGTNPSTYGSGVTFTATITPSTAGAAMTGTVTFFNGNVALGSSTVGWNGSTGTASQGSPSLLAGSDAITVIDSGDSNYSQSTSSALSQTVNKATCPVLRIRS